MLQRVLSALFLVVLSLSLRAQQDLSQFVNPLIGTGGHGHTFPGATLPFGMVQLSPDTRIDGSWDGCGGYHYSDTLIYGFSHTHLSGVGVSDYGDIMLMPTSTRVHLDPKQYASAFDHETEKATAGYYSVYLDDAKVKAELTATTRAGFHQYTFDPDVNTPGFVLDLNHRDKLTEGKIQKAGDRALQGFRRSEAWAKDQVVYFYMEFSEPFAHVDILDNLVFNGRYGSNQELGALISFSKRSQIQVKVGISGVSIEGARKNLETEISGWDFEGTRNSAAEKWNSELGRIEVSGGNTDQQTIFYTALYHCMTAPNIFNDTDGRYRGHDNQIHTADHNVYTVFSLWDTFRALHPLLTLIDPDRTSDFIKTFLLNYQQGGRLPVWELAANETDCMIGYHAVPVIVDAAKKGVAGFDRELAFTAMKHSAMLDHFGLKAYREKGFIEVEDEPESVSKTLEYAYDDWCIAEFAKLLDKPDDFRLFNRRSYNWINVLDPRTGNMRPRSNGGWMRPFDAIEVNNNFTEGNSWQYSFFVPHHYGKLKAMQTYFGYNDKLGNLFASPSTTTGREQADITGLIGQYAHGNEPSHHMAYLFNAYGQPGMTSELVDRICREFYKNEPDGLIGNEDCGQMSAWYVFSAMGFYPVCPGSNQYVTGSPLFDEVLIRRKGKEAFKIEVNRTNPEDIYVERISSGGKDMSLRFIDHEIFSTGDSITFSMVEDPVRMELPDTTFAFPEYMPAPVVNAAKMVFGDSVKVQAGSFTSFTLSVNDSAPLLVEAHDNKADTSFYVYATSVIKAQNTGPEEYPLSATAHVFKKSNNWKVRLYCDYNPQYSAGGEDGLIDGLRGDLNWRKGRWQGFQDQDFEAVIDLREVKTISTFGGSFLQDTRSWILMPLKVSYETSVDGTNWSPAGEVKNTVADNNYEVQIASFVLEKPAMARYVKVKARNYGKLPVWHMGAGHPAFIFVDELWVK